METLKSHKFVEYFSAKANFKRSIKSAIKPPKGAKEIFMGGGIVGCDVVKMGVFGTPEELFDQREHPHGEEAHTEAKSVRKYYSYYDSGRCQPIGFSKSPTIRLNDVDNLDLTDKSKLSAVTTGARCTLWRCGTSNWRDPTDFDDTFKIVFYYRT